MIPIIALLGCDPRVPMDSDVCVLAVSGCWIYRGVSLATASIFECTWSFS